MSRISESALKNKPKKPLNAYFKFRGEKMVEYEGEEDRAKKVKKEWDELDEKVKKGMEAEYKEELDKFK